MPYSLNQTGERYLPWVLEKDYLTGYEHIHRYLLASRYVVGKRVLDISCGEGYGTAMLAHAARSVVGIDIDGATVKHAREHHARDNVHFVQADAQHFGLAPGSIDVVVSFETIEHFADQEAFLASVASALADDGVMIVSTPNPVIYTTEAEHHNPFHVRELPASEFSCLLKRFFTHVELRGQRIIATSAITEVTSGYFLRGERPWRMDVTAIDEDQLDYPTQSKSTLQPRYYVALCSNKPLPPIPNSLMVDNEQALMRSLFSAATEYAGAQQQVADSLADTTSYKRTAMEQERRLDALGQQITFLNERKGELRALLRNAHAQLTDRDDALLHLSTREDTLTQAMAEKNRDIEAARQHAADHERHIEAQLREIENRDRHIEAQLQEIENRDHYIVAISQHAEGQERHIAAQLQEIENRDHYIIEQARRITDLETQAEHQVVPEQSARIHPGR